MTAVANGLCHCGCGQKTSIAKRTYGGIGIRKGQPYRYVKGHARRTPRGAGHGLAGSAPCVARTRFGVRSPFGHPCSRSRSHQLTSRAARASSRCPRPLRTRRETTENPGCVNPDHVVPLPAGVHRAMSRSNIRAVWGRVRQLEAYIESNGLSLPSWPS